MRVSSQDWTFWVSEKQEGVSQAKGRVEGVYLCEAAMVQRKSFPA